jgi:hypothetical protein
VDRFGGQPPVERGCLAEVLDELSMGGRHPVERE